MTPDSGKKRKVEESRESSSQGRNVRLLLDSDENESFRRVVCVSEKEDCCESGSSLAPFDPNLYSILVAWSQTNPRKEPKEDSEDTVYCELQEL